MGLLKEIRVLSLVAVLIVTIVSLCTNILLLERHQSTRCSYRQAPRSIREDSSDSHEVEFYSPQAAFPPSVQQGYILALRHYEQQTQAVRNFLELQCMAHWYGMRVVEPFVDNSFLAYPLDRPAERREKLLKFSELVDTDAWNREVTELYQYRPLATWSEFLQKAPRNLIIVCIKYRSPPNIEVPPPGSDFRRGCPEECLNKHFQLPTKFLAQYGFKIVRRSCANFLKFAGTVTTEEFLKSVIGYYPANNVTVLLSEFRGLLGLYRLPVLSTCAMIHHKFTLSVSPSLSVMKNANKYISTVLHNQLYVGVLVRVEKMVLYYNVSVSMCARELRNVFNDIHDKYGIKGKFLGMDVGVYGSQGSINRNYQSHGEEVVNALFNKTLTFQEWEQTFTRMMPRESGGYVASVQQAIAAKAHCLVMVGGGGFQSKAKTLYERFHPDTSSQCIYRACMKPMKRDVWKS